MGSFVSVLIVFRIPVLAHESGSPRTSSVYCNHSGATSLRSSIWYTKKPPTYGCEKAFREHSHCCCFICCKWCIRKLVVTLALALSKYAIDIKHVSTCNTQCISRVFHIILYLLERSFHDWLDPLFYTHVDFGIAPRKARVGCIRYVVTRSTLHIASYKCLDTRMSITAMRVLQSRDASELCLS